jgi:hypothetical protein
MLQLLKRVIRTIRIEQSLAKTRGSRGLARISSSPLCSPVPIMLGFVREKVSKNKIRFRDEQEGFDLDLTCILTF